MVIYHFLIFTSMIFDNLRNFFFLIGHACSLQDLNLPTRDLNLGHSRESAKSLAIEPPGNSLKHASEINFTYSFLNVLARKF